MFTPKVHTSQGMEDLMLAKSLQRKSLQRATISIYVNNSRKKKVKLLLINRETPCRFLLSDLFQVQESDF